MYSRLGRPRWGSVAAVTALTVDAASITLYCARPQWFGDARVAFRNPERRPEARPLFVAVACLAGLRGLFHAWLALSKRGADVRRATLERCYAAHALACLVIAVLAALAKTSAATPAIQLHRFVLVVLGLIAATFYRYSWSFLQTRPPVERDIFLMASETLQATQDALRRMLSTHGEATSLIDVEAQPDLAQRFLARSESVKNYWRSQLETIMSVNQRAPSPTQDDAFSLLLRLFAHEDVVDQLRTALMNDRTALLFYALQLSTFVLFGAYRDGDRMRDLLLDLCASDLAFAHRVAFYLRAFADSSDLSPGLNLTAAGEAAVAALSADVAQATHAFARTLTLADALTRLSSELCDVDRDERQAFLESNLRSLDHRVTSGDLSEAELAVGGFSRRVVRVHFAESRAFSTRDRCPYLCVVEVVSEAPPSERSPSPAFNSHSPAELIKNALREDEALGQWKAPPEDFFGTFGPSSPPPRRPPSPIQHGEPLAPRVAAELPPQKPPVVFRERWSETRSRLLHARNHALVPIIVKARDDLRQEQFASQLIKACALTLDNEKVPVRLPAYDVVATGPDSGLIEALPDTVSLDALRKHDLAYSGLLDLFRRRFTTQKALQKARKVFVESLAPACVVSYLLQLKDRHNGNILLHASGAVAHVDYGYLLASSPGGNMGFEAAPFKLTRDFLEVLGHDLLPLFRDLCHRTFVCLRRNSDKLLLLAEMAAAGCDHLPCFDGRAREALDGLKRRFRPELSERQCRAFMNSLIREASMHWRTRAYDGYQTCCNGIL